MLYFARENANVHKNGNKQSCCEVGTPEKMITFPTGLIKARHFLYDQHLKDIECASDPIFSSQASAVIAPESDWPQSGNCLVYLTGEVKSACCHSLAGRLGFHNHVLAMIFRYASLLSIAVLLPKICARNRINNLHLHVPVTAMAQERWRESHGMATSYRNWRQ